MSNNIKEYIQKSGLKNKFIANKIGCHNTEISQWISGGRTPTRERLKMLAQILNCRMIDLFPDIKFKMTYKINKEER